MILKRLFGRKKPSSTPPPEDRAGPIRSIPDHPDAGFRREACRRTEHLSELRNLTTSDPDAGVREVASAYYRRLLCGQKAEGPDLAQRLEELATLEDQNLLQQVALTGREAELRRAAITELRSQDVIVACALTDPLAINRSLVVESLDH